MQSASSFDMGSLASVTTEKYLCCVKFLTSVLSSLSVCPASSLLSDCTLRVFLCIHILLSIVAFFPVQIIVLTARKAFELSDFIQL